MMLNKKKLCIYTALSLAAGILSAAFVKSDYITYKIINAFFVGALVSLIPGLLSYVKSLGLLDSFFYGFRLLRRYSKHFEDEQDNKPEDYYEYKMEKGIRQYSKEPILIGLILLSVSILMSLIYV